MLRHWSRGRGTSWPSRTAKRFPPSRPRRICPEVALAECRSLQNGEAGDGPGCHIPQFDLPIEPRPDVEHPRAGVPLEQADDGLCLPCRHVVVAGDLTSLQVALTIDDEGPPVSVDDVSPDNVCWSSCREIRSNESDSSLDVMLSQSIGGSPAITRSRRLLFGALFTALTASISSSACAPKLLTTVWSSHALRRSALDTSSPRTKRSIAS